MQCELITWAEIERLCKRLAGMIRDSGYKPDIVITIGRGGYVPARLLCDYLHLMNMTSIKIEHYYAGVRKQKQAVIRYPLKADIENLQVLLVDDVNDTGDTLDLAIRHLKEHEPAEIRTAVMHNKIITHFTVDYFARNIIKWRWLIYPWAVYEDIAGFLRDMAVSSPKQAQQILANEYSIRISLNRLMDIYDSIRS
mgnify:FL=1